MHPDSFDRNVTDEDALPSSWIEALRALPSEHGGPSAETEAAVIASAQEILAAIRRRRLRRRLWPTLAAAACLVLAATVISRTRSTPPNHQAKAVSEDKYAIILREVSIVFPRQIKAIFADGAELEIELSDAPLSGKEQAVLIEIGERETFRAVITYVGQTVQIGHSRISVSANRDGSLVIDNQDFSESSGNPAQRLSIKTRPI